MQKNGLPMLILLLIIVGTLFFLYSTANQSQIQLSADREALTKFSAEWDMWVRLTASGGPRDPSALFEPLARDNLLAILASPSISTMETLGLVSSTVMEALKRDLADPARFSQIGQDFPKLTEAYRAFEDSQAHSFKVLELSLYVAAAALGALVVFWILDERRRRDRYRELQAAYRQSLVSLEEERHRIALDLHDTVAQELVALKFQVARAVDDVASKAQMHQSLERAQATLRQIAQGLRPPSIGQVGLLGALGELCQEFTRTSGLAVSRELEGTSVPGLSADREIHIYRIVQESLNNAWKHARCTGVSVATWCEDGLFKVRIRDDGSGVDPQTPSSGMGLAGMRERTALLGAKLVFKSSPGNGTEVLLEVPL